ncbi:MAG: hypothetical protein DSZ12_00080 [Sulfurovum sp.]|nr:MAG: hypothetical protein DSZ12_00080 [Sulfurovum sp.]
MVLKAGYKVQPSGTLNSWGGANYHFDVITPDGKRWLYPDKIVGNRETKRKSKHANVQEKMKEIYLKIYHKTLCKKKE